MLDGMIYGDSPKQGSFEEAKAVSCIPI